MATDTEQRGRHEGKLAPEPPSGRGRLDPRRIALGLASGLIATVVMTTFRMPISRSPPPTAYFWAKFVGDGEPEDYTVVGLALHIGYGMVGGVLFALLSPARTTNTEVSREKRGVIRGLVFGVLLSAFGSRVVLARLLGMDLDPDERFVFYLSHVVYGLTLGTWLGSRDE